MELHLEPADDVGLTRQIYRQVLERIVDGRLRPGDRLPPSRELARQLGLSRTTVTAAYEHLTAEGFLTGRVGAGTFVSAAPVHGTVARTAPRGAGVRPQPIWDDLPLPDQRAWDAVEYDFRIGHPDPSLFPSTAWRRVVAQQLRRTDAFAAGYADPAGHAGLRAGIARHVGLSRSVACDADDVLVTNGAQQALDLVARVLIAPGDVVAVEDPGHTPARHLFASHGAGVADIPVDASGIDVGALPDDARVVYVTPSHQFPLGTVMSLERRLALLEWAERANAIVVEDDYDSEFRFEDRPLQPLQSLDARGRVAYVGSFSKTMHPRLRLGFLVAPEALQAALRTARWLSGWHGDPVTQAAMAQFIDNGSLARHLRRTTAIYHDRHRRVLQGLRDHLHPWVEAVPSVAGIHVCARVRPGVEAEVDLRRVAATARRSNVAVETLADYSSTAASEQGVLLGYGLIAAEQIDDGLAGLARAFRRSSG